MKQSRWLTIGLLECVAASGGHPSSAYADDFTLAGVLADATRSFTAPVRSDGSDWLFFGGLMGAIAVAHDLDSRVRDHFAPSGVDG